MRNTINYIDGKKTYILAVLVAVYNLLVATNVISTHDQLIIDGLFGGGIAAALRSAVAKLEAKLPKPVEQVVAPVVEAEVNQLAGKLPVKQ